MLDFFDHYFRIEVNICNRCYKLWLVAVSFQITCSHFCQSFIIIIIIIHDSWTGLADDRMK